MTEDWAAGLIQRARDLAAGTVTAVPTKDAATVVLTRDSSRGLEVYLLRRVSSMAFAAGMYVFPGGAVDPRDAEASIGWCGRPPDEWAATLTATDAGHAQALVCAAVRETFEESGVLLAGTPQAAVPDVSDDSWEADRQALLDRSLSFADLLQRRDLVLRADLLEPWSHWITPEVEHRRYDTRFFVASLPEGQSTRHVGGEADRVAWMRPAEALERQAAGDFAMLPPTIATLSEISDLASTADVMAAARRRTVSPMMPKIVPDGEGIRLLLPGMDGYDG